MEHNPVLSGSEGQCCRVTQNKELAKLGFIINCKSTKSTSIIQMKLQQVVNEKESKLTNI